MCKYSSGSLLSRLVKVVNGGRGGGGYSVVRSKKGSSKWEYAAVKFAMYEHLMKNEGVNCCHQYSGVKVGSLVSFLGSKMIPG